jgi:hypothetical protein
MKLPVATAARRIAQAQRRHGFEFIVGQSLPLPVAQGDRPAFAEVMTEPAALAYLTLLLARLMLLHPGKDI